jgi:formylglycine-generating enzyme required for sulfatase activity
MVRAGVAAVLVAGVRLWAHEPIGALEGVALDSGNAVISVRTQHGHTYAVDRNDGLGAGGWVQVRGNITATGGIRTVNDPGGAGLNRRFYRVRITDASPVAPTGMAFIPAGTFSMGNAKDADEGAPPELPVHAVFVSAFFIDKLEVSKALWDEVAAWASTHGYDIAPVGWEAPADHPVYWVNWHQTAKWCNARSEREGLTPCYRTTTGGAVWRAGLLTPACEFTADGYRLPTEAEWERAARGGASSHRFPWSDAETITHARANYFSSALYLYDVSPTRGMHPSYSTSGTSPVGAFAANAFGLHDMAGNVAEWCWDRAGSGYYAVSPGSDPTGPESGPERVVRGGEWDDSTFTCRVAARGWTLPGDIGVGYIGFRCVRR